MIHIQLAPFVYAVPTTIEASVKGDVITINGEDFDFGPLQEGQRLPYTAIDALYFVPGSFVERKNGELLLSLFLPVQFESPEEVRNPAKPIVLSVKSGKVPFPDATPVPPPPLNVEPPKADGDEDEN